MSPDVWWRVIFRLEVCTDPGLPDRIEQERVEKPALPDTVGIPSHERIRLHAANVAVPSDVAAMTARVAVVVSGVQRTVYLDRDKSAACRTVIARPHLVVIIASTSAVARRIFNVRLIAHRECFSKRRPNGSGMSNADDPLSHQSTNLRQGRLVCGRLDPLCCIITDRGDEVKTYFCGDEEKAGDELCGGDELAGFLVMNSESRR
jgi:hypothetical protein